jgi:arylsulfatase
MKHALPIFCVLLLASLSTLPADAAPRPNIVIFLADDMGFSDAGCYGGEIATPNLDKLAANGLRFTQFYNTSRCWPTRSCILSGYYAQQIRMDPPRGRLPAWTRLLPQHLKPLGYRTYHVGKWHVLGAPKPVADGGFDHSYWFEDWDRYFSPVKHYQDDVQAPPVKPDSGYYATTAFADRAIGFLKQHATHNAAKPFFLYLAFIAPHFPLQAPAKDVASYRDTYWEGWDVVRQRRYERMRQAGIIHCGLAAPEPKFLPRYFKPQVLETLGPGEIPYAVPWNALTDAQKKYQATKMSIHAAMITRMDREIGRVIEQIRSMGAWEDTLLFFLSDNGTDATIMVRGDGHDRSAPRGSWQSFLCLGPGWSTVGNTPFRRHKVWVHEGGISTPLIVHWPKGIAARGELRHDVGHAIDFVPTLLELTGATPAPANGAPPLPGHSLVPALARDGAVARDYVFFHHEGNRALRMGDYKLVSAREDNSTWELFNLANDRCEQHNLAAAQPSRVRDMAARWQQLQDEFTRNAGLTKRPAGNSRH